MKKVTILFASYNKKETIKNCLDSLLALNYPLDKILILDGGSKDGTYEILREYQKKYLEKINLHQMLIDHSERINWALDNIETEYIALTDADCVVEKDWLDNLLAGFDQEENIIATAGYCGTPKDISLLQRLIGLEMDNRFNRLPRYLYRAPTMNLCLKTNIARKVRFDEKQKIAIETDFGFRLTKYGKMFYCQEAKVWHYHRSSLKNYFKQQSSQAKWGLRLIFKHRGRAISDPITSFGMTAQIPLFLLTGLFLILSLVNILFLYFSAIFFLILLLIYAKNLAEIKPPIRLYPLFFPFFLFRTFAWVWGVINGAILFFGMAIKRQTI